MLTLCRYGNIAHVAASLIRITMPSDESVSLWYRCSTSVCWPNKHLAFRVKSPLLFSFLSLKSRENQRQTRVRRFVSISEHRINLISAYVWVPIYAHMCVYLIYILPPRRVRAGVALCTSQTERAAMLQHWHNWYVCRDRWESNRRQVDKQRFMNQVYTQSVSGGRQFRVRGEGQR